jgi:hypothetical protein
MALLGSVNASIFLNGLRRTNTLAFNSFITNHASGFWPNLFVAVQCWEGRRCRFSAAVPMVSVDTHAAKSEKQKSVKLHIRYFRNNCDLHMSSWRLNWSLATSTLAANNLQTPAGRPSQLTVIIAIICTVLSAITNFVEFVVSENTGVAARRYGVVAKPGAVTTREADELEMHAEMTAGSNIFQILHRFVECFWRRIGTPVLIMSYEWGGQRVKPPNNHGSHDRNLCDEPPE